MANAVNEGSTKHCNDEVRMLDDKPKQALKGR